MQSLFGKKKSFLAASTPPSPGSAAVNGRTKDRRLPSPLVERDENRRHASAPTPSRTPSALSVSSPALEEELAIAYGYWGIHFDRDLSAVQAQNIIELCGSQIKSRGRRCCST